LLTFLFFFMRAAVSLSVLRSQYIVSALHRIPGPFLQACVSNRRTAESPSSSSPNRGKLKNVQLASLRLQISMNCLISETSEGILADFDESVRIVRFGIVKFAR
jgi:hypothetical protein